MFPAAALLIAIPHPMTKAFAGRRPFKLLHADSIEERGDAYILNGAVSLIQGQSRIRADEIIFDKRSRIMTARENVVLEDGTFRLECGAMEYETDADTIMAYDNLKLRYEEGDDTAVELSAFRMILHPRARRIEAREAVVLTRYERGGTSRKKILSRIRCERMKADIPMGTTSFEGHVYLETPSVGACAGRCTILDATGRIILEGAAAAWNYDEKGNPVNRIEGSRIVHIPSQRRTLVMGGVTAELHLDRKTKEKELPLEEDPLEPVLRWMEKNGRAR